MISVDVDNKRDRNGVLVLSSFIDALSWGKALERIASWGCLRDSRMVCLCNVHSSVTATKDKQLGNALANSDMVLPDGAPIAWMLRRKGFKKQSRIAGPDLMLKLCAKLQGSETCIFLFGSSDSTLARLEKNLVFNFPELIVAGRLSPRFGDWSNQEEEAYIKNINESGAGIIFVGLGCPKQEIWMANNREKINGVLIGVGAAFDFHAGTIKRAPLIYQRTGLEWLHRLISQPRRLWKRYLTTNSKFLWYAGKELLLRR